MCQWVENGVLARSSRPGYPAHIVNADVVQNFVADVKASGIQSILCFLDLNQLEYYNAVPNGLLEYYRSSGLTVAHVPITDHNYPPISAEEMKAAFRCYDNLPRPVLVHCSAGRDRTGAFVKALESRRADREALTGQIASFMEENSMGRGEQHFNHVTYLADSIFELVKDIAYLSAEDRILLKHAALVHDVGTVRGSSMHAWNGSDMIMDNLAIACGREYALVIAQIASLHGIDENTDAHGACTPEGAYAEAIGAIYSGAFPEGTRSIGKRIAALAGILRVADGYDRSLNAETDGLAIDGFNIKAKKGLPEDLARASAKSALLNAATGITVEA